MGLRVLVCGGRDYRDKAKLFHALDQIHLWEHISVIIEGDASGADHLAARWARERCVPRFTFFAEWNRYGPAAGPLRNAKMLAEGKPDLVVAFPGGKGTADMVAKAREANVTVQVVAP